MHLHDMNTGPYGVQIPSLVVNHDHVNKQSCAASFFHIHGLNILTLHISQTYRTSWIIPPQWPA